MKFFTKFLFVVILLCLASVKLHADNYTIQWADTLNNGSNDYAQSVAIDNEGHIYITGYSTISGNFDYLTVKYDSTGNIIWIDTLDNGENDQPYGIAVDNNYNVCVTGLSYINGSYDYLTVKYDSLGHIVWEDTVIAGNGLDIAVDDKNNVYVTGDLYVNSTDDYFTVKYDSLGNTIWADTFDNGGKDIAQGIAVDKNGNVYVTGYSNIDSINDYFTLKYDSLGNIVWADTLNNSSDDRAQGITLDRNGNVYVTGYSHIDTTDDWLTVKYNSTGNIIWIDTLNNGMDDYADGITTDDKGNIYITGASKIEGNTDYFTVKYDSSGNIVWEDTLENGSFSFANGIAVDSNENIYITGNSYVDTNYDFLTLKYLHLYSDKDIGIVSITSPDSGFISPSYYNVSAIVKNFGNVSESFDVYAEVIDTTNGWTTISRDTVSISNLAAGDTSTVVFDSCDYQANAVYLTRVYVNLPDTNTANDTAEIYSSTMHYYVMFVEDAEGYGAPHHPDSTWYVPLTNLVGKDSVYWYLTTNVNQDGPDLAAMEHANLVIWNTYNYFSAPSFTDNDTTNINDYINEGGKVWLIGQDFVYTMSKSAKRNRLERAIFPWLDKFGVDSVIEDYLEDTVMTIQGTGQVAGNPISVHSDFNTSYSGGHLYPDIIYPDTSAQAVLIDPDSSVTIGIITNDSTKAFWAADGRGADLTPGGDWETLIDKMLSLFGITHQGINEKAVIESKSVKTSLVVKRTVNTMMDFSYRGNRKAEILVSDINGRIVKRFVNVNPGSRLSIESNTLTAGIYFITVKGTNVISKVTVIK